MPSEGNYTDIVERPRDAEEGQEEEVLTSTATQARQAAAARAEHAGVDYEEPIEVRLEREYRDWSDEDLQRERERIGPILAAAAEEFGDQHEILREGARKDASEYATSGVDESEMQWTNFGRAQQRVASLELKIWHLSRQNAALDLVRRMRQADDLSARQEELFPKVEKLEAKIRNLTAELNDLRGELADLGERRRNTTERWKDRLDEYASLDAGPHLSGMHKFLFGNDPADWLKG